MSLLARLDEPEGLAVLLPELKAELFVTHTSAHDDRLTEILRGQTTRYEHFTGRVMLPTAFALACAGWYEPIRFPVHPLREITAITYLDGDGAEQTLDAGAYRLERWIGGREIRFTADFTSPALADVAHPVTVTFSAGHNDPAGLETAPDPDLAASPADRLALKLMTARVYEGGTTMTDEELRHYFGHRRLYR